MRDSLAHRPPPVRCDTNSFANHTMRVRVPNILHEVLATNPDYPAGIVQAVETLRDDMREGKPIRRLDNPLMVDDAAWQAEYDDQQRIVNPLTWHTAEWWFAEVYGYRALMQAVRWYETGRDPFAPKKRDEITHDQFWRLVNATQDITAASPTEALSALLWYALWGNRVDLSHSVSARKSAEMVDDDDLLVDDRAAVITRLLSPDQRTIAPGIIHLIADNTGTELALDLALVDNLLINRAEQVILHLKLHPTFVSDAIPSDVWTLLHAMREDGGKPAALAARLQTMWEVGRLRLLAHPYWNSTRYLWEMPTELYNGFQDARLVILKGDANYRRAVGDAIWDATGASFADVLAYFPAPLVALRTLKSDALAGISVEKASHLNTEDKDWRTNGKRGLIQLS